MGKRKVLNEAQLKEMVLAQEGEMYGQVIKLVGSDHLVVKCADGKTRLGRIRGKIRRRVWIRLGDIVLLVRKGFLSKYIEFDASLGRAIRDLKAAFICAFDRRELLAAGIKDPATEISELHSVML